MQNIKAGRKKGGENVTLKDLCPSDKAKIKQLVEDLARMGTEKDRIEIDRQKDKMIYEEKLSNLLKQQDQLLKEKVALENHLRDSKKNLTSLQEKTELLVQGQKDIKKLQQKPAGAYIPLPYSTVPGNIPSILPVSSGSASSMLSGSTTSIHPLKPGSITSILPMTSGIATSMLPGNIPMPHQSNTYHLHHSNCTSTSHISHHKLPTTTSTQPVSNNSTTSWCTLCETPTAKPNKLDKGTSPLSCDYHVMTENTPPTKKNVSIQTISSETIGTQTDKTSPIIPLIKRKVKRVLSPAVQKEIFVEGRDEEVVSALLNNQPLIDCEDDIIASLQKLSHCEENSLVLCVNDDSDLLEELFFI